MKTESAQTMVCTCPSGDGSLRWPCPVHPAATQGAVEPKGLFIDMIAQHPGLAGELKDAVEPVYQLQLASGEWIDQTEESYAYNARHGQATVRTLYTTSQVTQADMRAALDALKSSLIEDSHSVSRAWVRTAIAQLEAALPGEQG